MRSSKFASTVYAILGVVFALAAVILSLCSLHASPVLVSSSDGSLACARAMLDHICAGDYAAAGTYMYGSPALTSGADTDSETGRMIWNAFVDSLEYEFVGESYASGAGVSQNVRITGMELASVTERLKERSQTILSQRVEKAEDVSEIYGEDNNYKEAFVMEVLREATVQALEEDVRYVEQELTLNLVFDHGKWVVIADQALLSAISGGTAG